MVGRPYGAIASRSARNGISAVSGGIRGGPLARWRNPARLSPVDVLRGGEPAGAQSGGTPHLISLAIMWPPCSAAIPLNDSSYLYAMGKSANCSADPCADSPPGFTAGHSRHYAANKSHPPDVPMRPK
jgi:hypothetical protein